MGRTDASGQALAGSLLLQADVFDCMEGPATQVLPSEASLLAALDQNFTQLRHVDGQRFWILNGSIVLVLAAASFAMQPGRAATTVLLITFAIGGTALATALILAKMTAEARNQMAAIQWTSEALHLLHPIERADAAARVQSPSDASPKWLDAHLDRAAFHSYVAMSLPMSVSASNLLFRFVPAATMALLAYTWIGVQSVVSLSLMLQPPWALGVGAGFGLVVGLGSYYLLQQTLRRYDDDATRLLQARRPIGLFITHPSERVRPRGSKSKSSAVDEVEDSQT